MRLAEATQKVADSQRDLLVMEMALKDATAVKEKVLKESKVNQNTT